MTRIAVIGAGIIGATLTESLRRRGAHVTVIDRGAIGGGVTANSLGWINANNRHPRSYHDLAAEALDAWRDLGARHGHPHWLRMTGHLTWAVENNGRQHLRDRIDRLNGLGYPAEMINRARAARLEPHLQLPDDATFGYFPTEGHLDGQAACVDILRTSRSEVIEHDTVTDFLTADREIRGLRLASGRTITADEYVCCAGWHTPQVLAQLGIDVPLIPVDKPAAKPPCLVVTVTAPPDVVSRVVQAPSLKLRPAGDSSVQLEASDINAVTDLYTDDADLSRFASELVDRARQLLRPAATCEITKREVCVRPMPADGYPLIGRPDGWQNLSLVVTHSGVTLAPLLAELVASQLLDRRGSLRLAPYSLGRSATPP